MSKFKRAFTSRFHGGVIVEADWSQLEINVLAVESGDPVLTAELISGDDLHSKLTADIYEAPYEFVDQQVKAHDPLWVERRRQTKRARFALQYGAYAVRLAQLTGWTIEFAAHFIEAYYAKYKTVASWQRAVEFEVEKTSRPWGVDGARKGQYTSPSGRRYVFQTYPTKWGQQKFSSNQLKNYPIQGLAADFVAHMLGKLNRMILQAEWAPHIKLVNTIHDSVIFDVAPEWQDRARHVIHKVYDKAQLGMSEVVQGMRPVSVPLKYEISSGYSWSK